MVKQEKFIVRVAEVIQVSSRSKFRCVEKKKLGPPPNYLRVIKNKYEKTLDVDQVSEFIQQKVPLSIKFDGNFCLSSLLLNFCLSSEEIMPKSSLLSVLK